MYFVYIIENKLNGKAYVGQTNDPDFRWKKHRKKDSGCPYINRAVRKYGRENFTFSIVDSFSTIEEAYEGEKFWIKELGTLSPKGYNLKEGGLGGGFDSESTRKKKSFSKLGKKNHFFGKSHSQEAKDAISSAKKGVKLRLSPEERQRRRDHMATRLISEETRAKLSAAARARDCATWRGKKHSEETKRKMAEARKKWWAEKKAQEVSD